MYIVGGLDSGASVYTIDSKYFRTLHSHTNRIQCLISSKLSLACIHLVDVCLLALTLGCKTIQFAILYSQKPKTCFFRAAIANTF